MMSAVLRSGARRAARSIPRRILPSRILNQQPGHRVSPLQSRALGGATMLVTRMQPPMPTPRYVLHTQCTFALTKEKSGKRKLLLLSNMSSSITHSSMWSRDANILTACSATGVHAHISYHPHSALCQLQHSATSVEGFYDIHRPIVSALTIPTIFLAIPSRCICTRKRTLEMLASTHSRYRR